MLLLALVDRLLTYRTLALQGLDEFLTEAAPAALVRNRPQDDVTLPRGVSDVDEEETIVGFDVDELTNNNGSKRMEVYPLEKKPGAPFSDMITVGRTANNDVVLNDITVSRFHAYFKRRGDQWVVCDAGSKNGTQLDGQRLVARKERPVANGSLVRIGDIETAFYVKDALYELLLKA